MRTRYLLGAQVELINPLPHEHKGPWRVAGIKFHVVPTQYKLVRGRKGKPQQQIEVDEPEIVRHNPPAHHIQGAY